MFRENLCSTELKWMEGNAIDMETIELIVVFVVFVLRVRLYYLWVSCSVENSSDATKNGTF